MSPKNKQISVNPPANESGQEDSEFKKLLNSQQIKVPKVGDIIKGKIITVSRSEVRLDIDGLTTGIIRGREFFDESSEHTDLKIGDEVEATVIDLENENGEMELSLRFAGHKRAWENLDELRKGESIIQAIITDANKGGLMIKVGRISGFLPVSQLSPEYYPRVPGGDKNRILDRLKSYIGKKFSVKVLDINEEENKLIVSEKLAWEEKQKDVISKHKVDDVVEGEITAVTDFGVFVKFGENLEGLIHISELAWQRIDNPQDLVHVGDKIEAKIIAIEGSKIFLSSKKLKKDPWEKVSEKYKIGDFVTGKVLKINPFGLFVELDRDIHGLAHISELSDKPVSDIKKIAKIGDELAFRILSIEPVNHRLGLSLKPASKTAKAETPGEPKDAEAKTPVESKEAKAEIPAAAAEEKDVKDEKEEKPKEKKTKKGDKK